MRTRSDMRSRAGSFLLMAAVTAGSAWGSPAIAQDIAGSRDHPLLTRFPGAVIRAYDHKEFDAFRLPLGRATGNDAFADTRTIEGETTWIAYEIPKDRSTAEVFRSYRDALTAAGFRVVWQCETEAGCGNWFGHTYLTTLEPKVYQGEVVDEGGERFLAAHRSGPREHWVALFVYPAVVKDFHIARLRIVEAEAMAEGLVTVDAAAMASEIDRSGHVALYGIHFATNSATLEPASDATIAEIARLLANDAALGVYVVGHTDDTGTFEHNRTLSERRARAVVQALESRHGVASGRLQAIGVGPVAPVASNGSEEGRAKNRRVEIVPR